MVKCSLCQAKENKTDFFLLKIDHLCRVVVHFNCVSFKACDAWKKEAEKQERLLKQVEEERDFAVKIRDNVSQKFDPWAYFLAFLCRSQDRCRPTTFKTSSVLLVKNFMEKISWFNWGPRDYLDDSKEVVTWSFELRFTFSGYPIHWIPKSSRWDMLSCSAYCLTWSAED